MITSQGMQGKWADKKGQEGAGVDPFHEAACLLSTHPLHWQNSEGWLWPSALSMVLPRPPSGLLWHCSGEGRENLGVPRFLVTCSDKLEHMLQRWVLLLKESPESRPL